MGGIWKEDLGSIYYHWITYKKKFITTSKSNIVNLILVQNCMLEKLKKFEEFFFVLVKHLAN